MSSVYNMENDCDISGSENERNAMRVTVTDDLTILSKCEKGRKSWKWDNFENIASRVMCKTCNKRFSLETSTSILKKHISQHTTTESTETDPDISTPRRRSNFWAVKRKTSLNYIFSNRLFDY